MNPTNTITLGVFGLLVLVLFGRFISTDLDFSLRASHSDQNAAQSAAATGERGAAADQTDRRCERP